MNTSYLPFEIGQLVESRCFLIGYRGAWFQCKIKDIGWRMGSLSYELEFVDFPDEEVVWTKPFQKPPAAFGIPIGSKGQLMLRPRFPHVYREKDLSKVGTHSQPEDIVVVNDVWKVGDLVDWWKDNCHWSSKIVAILGAQKVKVELLPPPFGEGLTYDAACKDLRPSLNWSLESGWTVPTSEVNGNSCARVLKHVNEAQKLSEVGNGSQAGATDGLTRTLKRMHSDCVNGVSRKLSSLDDGSSSPAQGASTEIPGMKAPADGGDDDWSLKKMIPDISLNSMHDDSLEAAILDLEELINRVKWIKGILECGMPQPNASRSSWKFLEHRPSCTSL